MIKNYIETIKNWLRKDSDMKVDNSNGKLFEIRCKDFYNLKDGWYQEDSIAPIKKGIDWIIKVFKKQYVGDLPFPIVSPTVTGNIKLEWYIGNYNIELDVYLRIHTGYYWEIKSNDDTVHTMDLDLDDNNSWNWLKSRLERAINSERTNSNE